MNINSALICTNLKKEKSQRITALVCEKLLQFGITPFMDKIYEDYSNKESFSNVVFGELSSLINSCDMFLTIGGDGTILRWGKQAASVKKPLLGVNTGRLGFMATLECDELDKLKLLKTGDYFVSKRMLLDVKQTNTEGVENEYLALNDIVLNKSRYAKLPEFVISTKGFEVSKIRADGLIFSTPTGSTAYSLSAGGPIIEPEAECVEFTPLCAHTLFGRPMVFTGKNAIEIKYAAYENSDVILSVDGDDVIDFKEGEILRITKSQIFLELIDIDGGSFYSAVHNKLMQPLK